MAVPILKFTPKSQKGRTTNFKAQTCREFTPLFIYIGSSKLKCELFQIEYLAGFAFSVLCCQRGVFFLKLDKMFFISSQLDLVSAASNWQSAKPQFGPFSAQLYLPKPASPPLQHGKPFFRVGYKKSWQSVVVNFSQFLANHFLTQF